jgi:hypothetical protein
MTDTRHPVPQATRRQRISSLAVRAVRIELRVYESLWRAAVRRPSIAAGARGFGYHRPVLTILLVFIGLSALEIPIVDLIVHRWTPVRIGFLALGIWGVTWMLGLLCAYFTRPHTVGPDGIRVREGLELELPVTWDDFASLELRPTTIEGKPGRVFDDGDDRVCAVKVGSQTNLEIRFERPTKLRLPGLAPKGGAHTVTVLRFWADDPRALLDAVRAQLPDLD